MLEAILIGFGKLLQNFLGKRIKRWFALRAYQREQAKILVRNGIAGDDERFLDLKAYEVPDLVLVKHLDLEPKDKTNNGRVKILDLLQMHNLIVVTGDPGAGKSTLLKFLQDQYLCKRKHKGRKHRLLPVLIRIREWAQSGLSFREYVNGLNKGGFITLENEDHLLLNAFDNGGLLILLDGLDEAGTDYDRMRDFIQKLGQECFVGNKIVVTTRKTGYHAALVRFKHFELDGLRDEQVLAIAKKVFDGAVSAEAFLEIAQQVTELDAYIRNPFMLQLLLHIYRNQSGSLPATKVGILDKSIERLLRIQGSNTFERDQKLKWAKTFLQQLASSYLDDIDLDSISLDLINDAIVHVVRKQKANEQKIRVYLESLVQTAGVLWESQRGKFSFMHRSFMEYLCGSYLASIHQPIKLLRPLYFFSEYEEVIRFAVASWKHDPEYADAVKANALIKDILDQKPWQFELLKQPELLAGLCVGEFGDGIYPEFCRRIKECLIELARQLQSCEATERMHIIAHLWGGSKEMREVAAKWMTQYDSATDPMERLTLVNALNAIGPQNQDIMRFFVRVFEKDPGGFVRDRALDCLCLWHELKHVSVERLFEILISAPEQIGSITLEDALGEVAATDPSIKDRLKKIALDAKEPEIRERVFDVLHQEQFHSPEIVGFLLDRLRREKDEYVAQSIDCIWFDGDGGGSKGVQYCSMPYRLGKGQRHRSIPALD